MKFLEIYTEVLVPKFIRAEVRLPDKKIPEAKPRIALEYIS